MFTLSKSNARIRFDGSTYFDFQFNSMLCYTGNNSNDFAIIDVGPVIWFEVSLNIFIAYPEYLSIWCLIKLTRTHQNFIIFP